MYRLILIFLILITLLISCDGRDRVYQNNESVLRESKLFDSFSERINFQPKYPIQIITDTILSNGFKVIMNYTTNGNDFVISTHTSENNITTKNYYKTFEALLQVSKNETLILDTHIDKNLFTKFGVSSFWTHAIMQYVWIDYLSSTDNYINLKTSFHNPSSNKFKDFSLNIHENGFIEIEEIDLIPNSL